MPTDGVAKKATVVSAEAATTVRPAFTAASITNARPGETLYDDQVRGLQLRVSASGRKTFYLYYRTRSGQERRPKLGDVGTFTIATARAAAREWLAKVALGQDPANAWRAERDAPTVADAVGKWLEDRTAKLKPRTVAEYRRIVDGYIAPKCGRLRVAEIQIDDAEDLHRSLAATPYMANRVLACFSAFLSYAEKRRWRGIGTNPCQHVERYAETNRKRYMTKDEAPRVAAVLAKYEATRPQAVAFIYLLILSGARPDEITRAMPEWLERVGDGGALRLPDSKTGERTVYLPPQVMRVVDRLPIVQGQTLLRIKSPVAAWREIRTEAGAPDLRLYDLRHTFASAALKAGYSLAQIGELLGHANTQTTKRYAHLMEEKAHEAVTRTAGLLEQMMQATYLPAASSSEPTPSSSQSNSS